MRTIAAVCAAFFLAAGAAAAQDAKPAQGDTKAKQADTKTKPADKQAKPAETKGTVKGDPKRGEEVFATNKCTLCHSIAGKGNKNGPLDDIGSKLTAEEIRQWLINPAEMTGKTKATRKPPMSSFAKLPKEDLESLIAYLMTLKKK